MESSSRAGFFWLIFYFHWLTDELQRRMTPCGPESKQEGGHWFPFCWISNDPLAILFRVPPLLIALRLYSIRGLIRWDLLPGLSRFVVSALSLGPGTQTSLSTLCGAQRLSSTDMFSICQSKSLSRTEVCLLVPVSLRPGASPGIHRVIRTEIIDLLGEHLTPRGGNHNHNYLTVNLSWLLIYTPRGGAATFTTWTDSLSVFNMLVLVPSDLCLGLHQEVVLILKSI